MKRILLLSLVVLLAKDLQSQIDYSKIIAPSGVTGIDFQEKLVQLAWANHPSNRIKEEQIVVQKEVLKYDRMTWVSGFGATANLNEFTLNPDADIFNRSAFWPRYNVYARVDLGLIFLNPAKKRENLHKVKIAEESLNEQKLEVRLNVLQAYQDYIKFLEFYKIQSEITQDSYTEYLLIEEKFKNGQTTNDEFNRVLRNYNLQRKEKINSENQYLKAKYTLEYFIGVKIEDLL